MHPTDTYLDDKLGRFPSTADKKEFLRRLWQIRTAPHERPFFRHFEACIRFAMLSRFSLFITNQSNEDFFRVVEVLQSPIPLEEVMHRLEDRFEAGTAASASTEAIQCMIALVLRTWLMCNSGPIGNEIPEGQREMRWDKGSLRDALSEAFPHENQSQDKVRIERSFHARNIEKIASIQVTWTDNLLDHLRLQDSDQDEFSFRVSVFRHPRFLEGYRKSDMFPEDLISETIRTLAILLPGYEQPVNEWFQKQRERDDSLDPSLIDQKFVESEQCRIESFEYWRDRLVALKQAYDESEPRSISQWWNDGRRRVQWATFWVAAAVLLLTVVFGLIQSIEGALQVYKAYHSNGDGSST